jgi:hypothetical protein
MTSTVDISGFTRGMTGFVDKLGISGPVVLKKEMGELVKTLVKVTPGADAKKLAEYNEAKFDKIADKNNSWVDPKAGGKEGHGGLRWYSFTSNFIYGVAPEKDMRDATAEELQKLSWQITKSGRQLNLPIKGHKHQRALISQTILTKASTVKKMIALKLKNRGRLKAGWMVAVFQGALELTGGNQPPQWVTRHAAGARGYFINSLATPNFPSFTIANTAAGVGNSKNNLNWLVQKALNIRAKAMTANLALFMHGEKNLADYAQ